MPNKLGKILAESSPCEGEVKGGLK